MPAIPWQSAKMTFEKEEIAFFSCKYSLNENLNLQMGHVCISKFWISLHPLTEWSCCPLLVSHVCRRVVSLAAKDLVKAGETGMLNAVSSAKLVGLKAKTKLLFPPTSKLIWLFYQAIGGKICFPNLLQPPKRFLPSPNLQHLNGLFAPFIGKSP